MTDSLLSALIALAALGCGLNAGVFFAFSSFVMPALARLPAPQGIAAMQAINVAAINRWFMGALFGTAALGLALAVAATFLLPPAGSVWLLCGAAGLYLAGAILTTMLANVPLNNRLAATPPDSAEGAALWAEYLRRWTAWNHLRTLACAAAAALFLAA